MADRSGGRSGGGGYEEKISYFQAITGVDDADFCTEILTAHNWDLDLAINTFTSNPNPTSHTNPNPNPNPNDSDSSSNRSPSSSTSQPNESNDSRPPPPSPPPESSTIAWKLVTIPFYVVSGGASLISGAVGLGFWIAGGVLSRSLNLLGLLPPNSGVGPEDRLIPVSSSATEAAAFIAAFERDFQAPIRPNFVAKGFMEALQRSQREFKLMFVYLHSPDHPDVPGFCSRCLCSAPVAEFVNENFVAWGGSIRGTEGFKMSNSLKASRFPFCAVVMASTNQRIVLLSQVEGPETPEKMLTILQRVVEECTTSLVEARLDAEERRNNIRLREEQDAAYSAALEADQARERQRKEDHKRLEREAAEAERKRKEEEEALERAAQEIAEKQAALVRRRQEKAMALGEEPEKGPDVTQVATTTELARQQWGAAVARMAEAAGSPAKSKGGNYMFLCGFQMESAKKGGSIVRQPLSPCIPTLILWIA